MITNDAFERKVSDWLHADAEHRIPDHLEAVLRLTSAARQRPAWSSLERWLPMDTTFSGRVTPVMRPAWPLIVLLLLAALAAAIVLVGARQLRLPAPYGPADNGSILFSAHGDIRISKADGSDARVLIGGPEDDLAPLVSNDGTQFIFFRAGNGGFDVFAAQTDGTDARRLTRVPLQEPDTADWSPDGSRILVAHVVGGKPTISILDTDGDQGVSTLDVGDVAPDSPMWRPPDGREIVFRGSKDGLVALYTIAVDGGTPQRIAPEYGYDGAYLGPRISPDGTRVTFWHNNVANIAAHPEGTKSEVHVLDLGTRAEFRIGYDPTSRHELLPKFSPDGRRVLFVRFPVEGDAEILMAAADGSGTPRQIGPSQVWSITGFMENPTFEFSPDGGKVILSTGIDRRLQVIDIATGDVQTGDFGEFVFWQRLAISGPEPTPCPGGGGCMP